jgi:hypothetical protein
MWRQPAGSSPSRRCIEGDVALRRDEERWCAWRREEGRTSGVLGGRRPAWGAMRSARGALAAGRRWRCEGGAMPRRARQ